MNERIPFRQETSVPSNAKKPGTYQAIPHLVMVVPSCPNAHQMEFVGTYKFIDPLYQRVPRSKAITLGNDVNCTVRL